MKTDYLDRENRWFEEHRQELLKKYEGKWAVIRHQRLLGTYNTLPEAYEKGIKIAKSEEILVKQIVAEDEILDEPINLSLGLIDA